MLDRDEVRSFFRFLETASDTQLAEHRAHLDKMMGLLPRGTDIRKDHAFLMRKLVEEQAARANLVAVHAMYLRVKQ